jgi:hypothetical protein
VDVGHKLIIAIYRNGCFINERNTQSVLMKNSQGYQPRLIRKHQNPGDQAHQA